MDMNEFEKLLNLAAADGVITDRERELLLKKADQLGMDQIEAEMLIENAISELKPAEEKTAPDGYDISDSELIRRIQKWVQLALKDKEKVIVEPFPVVIKDATKFGSAIAKGQKTIGQIKDAGIVDAAASAVGFIPGAGFLTKKIGGAAVNGILDALSDTKEMKLTNEEFIGMAKQYLMILDQRKKDDPWLNEKFTELKEELNKNIETFNKIKNKNRWF